MKPDPHLLAALRRIEAKADKGAAAYRIICIFVLIALVALLLLAVGQIRA